MKLNLLSLKSAFLLFSFTFIQLAVKAQPVLDDISQKPQTAYSVRALTKNYKGAAMQIRRSSDDQWADVYFDSSGKLSMESPVSESPAGAATKKLLKDWIGNSSVYVGIWYDQSGNGNHAVQKNSDFQPRIIYEGKMEALPNGIPTLRMLNGATGGNGFNLPFNLSGLTDMNVFMAVRQDGAGLVGGHLFGTSGPTGATPGKLQMHYNNNTSNNTFGIHSSTAYGSNRLNLIRGNFYSVRFKLSAENDGTGQVFIAGKSSQPVTGTLLTVLDATKSTLFRIGSATYNRNFEGICPEVIVYNTVLSDTDAGKIMSGQRSYFGTK